MSCFYRFFHRPLAVVTLAAVALLALSSCREQANRTEPPSAVPETPVVQDAPPLPVPTAVSAGYFADAATTDLESFVAIPTMGTGAATRFARAGAFYIHCDGRLATVVAVASASVVARYAAVDFAIADDTIVILAADSVASYPFASIGSGLPPSSVAKNAAGLISIEALADRFLCLATDGSLHILSRGLAAERILPVEGNQIDAILAVSGNRALVGSGAATLLLDISLDRIVVSLDDVDPAETSSALDLTGMFLMDSRGKLSAYDPADGKLVWTTQAAPGLGDIAADGTAVYSVASGELYRYERKDGSLVVKTATEARSSPVLVAGNERLFLASADGQTVRDKKTLEPVSYSATRFKPFDSVLSEGSWAILGMDETIRIFGTRQGVGVHMQLVPAESVRTAMDAALEKYRAPGAFGKVAVRYRPWAEGAVVPRTPEFTVLTFEAPETGSYVISAKSGKTRFDGALLSAFSEAGEERSNNAGETPEGFLSIHLAKGSVYHIAAGFMHGDAGGAMESFRVEILPSSGK
ncbi:MAG: PQQ-binding-like beta-propeller repeat protein [Spirochaetes bacterium]|nr:PQQ-binding-like beta-propeller repeat protein [Spirochaetota bacterium]